MQNRVELGVYNTEEGKIAKKNPITGVTGLIQNDRELPSSLKKLNRRLDNL
jgi:hypothetical protein